MIYFTSDTHFGHKIDRLNQSSRLNGIIHLLRGNHDNSKITGQSRFSWIKDYHELKVPDEEMDLEQVIVLSHYPQARLDVGVDVHNFAPISYDQVKVIMTTRMFKPVDHHGRSLKIPSLGSTN